MKNLIAILILPLVVLAMVGCDDDNDDILVYEDKVPTTPQGVVSVTGNGEVLVFWNGIYEHDVKLYRVYRSLEATSGYTTIGSVAAVSNPNLDLLIYDYTDGTAVNGTTYFYAVTAVDFADQESELSAENVFDTPRPDGQGAMYPGDVSEDLAGFNLVTGSTVNWNSEAADIFVDRVVVDDGGTLYVYPYLNAANVDTDIQDMGYTDSFDDIGWAPIVGWSELGYCEAVVGHTYVVWTADNHFAKVRITAINAQGVISFQWAYQTSLSELGQLELSAPVRPEHGSDYPSREKSIQLLK